MWDSRVASDLYFRAVEVRDPELSYFSSNATYTTSHHLQLQGVISVRYVLGNLSVFLIVADDRVTIDLRRHLRAAVRRL